MRRHPAAVRQRLVAREDDASIGGGDVKPALAAVALPHSSPNALENFLAVRIHVAGEKPGLLRCWINSRSVQPGFTTSGDNLYMSR